MRFLTKNLGWKLLSLVIAFGIWISIASEPELATVISAPVAYKNYPRNLDISSTIVDKVEVEVRGPAGQLRELSDSRLSATVDFSSVTGPGERTFTLTGSELPLPRGLALIRTVPAQLRFRFEKRAQRKVRVEVPLSGNLPIGMHLLGVDVSPPELEIIGPESRVGIVKRAVTDPLDLSQLKGDSQQVLSVYVSDAEVRFAGAPRVTVKVHIARSR